MSTGCSELNDMAFSDSPGTTKFSDFECISIIGRGTFGKVYLVKNLKNGKYYAMKSIRKDIVVEHEAISNLQLEKMIMMQV